MYARSNLDIIDVLGDQGFKNILVATEIEHPGFALAGTITATDSGESWRFVYKSPLVKSEKSLGRLVADFVGDVPMIGEPQTIEDKSMMYGKGELALYEVIR